MTLLKAAISFSVMLLCFTQRINAQIIRFENIKIPTQICRNQQFSLSDSSVNGSKTFWNISKNLLSTKDSIFKSGKGESKIEIPSYIDFEITSDSTIVALVADYYDYGNLYEYFYKNSLRNDPVIKKLGNFSGKIYNQTQGIDIVKDGGKFYAFIVGTNGISRLDFGGSMTNIPKCTKLGNIGKMDWPHDLELIKYRDTWVGFCANRSNTNQLTRLVWKNGIESMPVCDNFTFGVGQQFQSSAIEVVQDQFSGNIILLITQVLGNTITRMNLGANPIGKSNLWKFDILKGPSKTDQPVLRGISIYKTCDGYVGLLGYESGGTFNIEFKNSLLNEPVFWPHNLNSKIPRSIDITHPIYWKDSLFFTLNTSKSGIYLISRSLRDKESIFVGQGTSTGDVQIPNINSTSLFIAKNFLEYNEKVFCSDLLTFLCDPYGYYEYPSEICNGYDENKSLILHLKNYNNPSQLIELYYNGAKAYSGYDTIIPIQQSGKYFCTRKSFFFSDTFYFEVNAKKCWKQELISTPATLCDNGTDTVSMVITCNLPYRTPNSFQLYFGGKLLSENNSGNFFVSKPGNYLSVFTYKDFIDSINFTVQSISCGIIDSVLHPLFFCPSAIDSIDIKVKIDAQQPKNGQYYLFHNQELLSENDKGVFRTADTGLFKVILKYPGSIDSQYYFIDAGNCKCEVYIPDAFSPNYDGVNDYFSVTTSCYLKSFTFEIYNRWGSRIFYASDIRFQWNQAPMFEDIPEGVYLYRCNAILSGSEQRVIKSGSINLIR